MAIAQSRSAMKSYVRKVLGNNFSMLLSQFRRDRLTYTELGNMTNTNCVIPWSTPEKLLRKFGVAILGWPVGCTFRNPSDLTMVELELVITAINQGTCYFGLVGRAEIGNIQIEGGWKRERKLRNDLYNCRGHQKRPAKPRKKGKTGKHVCSPDQVPEGYD